MGCIKRTVVFQNIFKMAIFGEQTALPPSSLICIRPIRPLLLDGHHLGTCYRLLSKPTLSVCFSIVTTVSQLLDHLYISPRITSIKVPMPVKAKIRLSGMLSHYHSKCLFTHQRDINELHVVGSTVRITLLDLEVRDLHVDVLVLRGLEGPAAPHLSRVVRRVVRGRDHLPLGRSDPDPATHS